MSNNPLTLIPLFRRIPAARRNRKLQTNMNFQLTRPTSSAYVFPQQWLSPLWPLNFSSPKFASPLPCRFLVSMITLQIHSTAGSSASSACSQFPAPSFTHNIPQLTHGSLVSLSQNSAQIVFCCSANC